MKTNTLRGKVALITGAGKGTGRQVAEFLAQQGAIIAANDLTPINLDETVRHITLNGGKVKAYIADIAKKLPIQGLLNQVVDDFGCLDILINCAEVEPVKHLLAMDEWDWVRTLDVNLTGAFLLTQSAARIMKEQGGGVILLLGTRTKQTGARAAYFASKAGLEAMISTAAQELDAWNIKLSLLDGNNDHLLEEVLTICLPAGNGDPPA